MSIYRIAEIAGLSPSSVSLALRNSPKISAATKERVRQIAAAEDYRPDARLNELMARMRLTRQARSQACLAVVSLYDKAKPWTGSAHHTFIYEGMANRARELGYRLEPMWLRAPGMTPRRFRGILEARGIEGMLCFGSPRVDDEFPTELGSFAIVSQGMSIRTPLHRVTGHFFNDVLQALGRLHRMGYRRPGLVISRYEDERSSHAYTGAYLAWCESQEPKPDFLPVLRMDRVADEPLSAWLQEHRPDVMLVVHDHASLGELSGFFRRQRIRVPRDLGVAVISQILEGSDFSGMRENQALIGRWAVELLVMRITNRDFGLPASPRVEMVESVWVKGKTLRRQSGIV